MNSAVSASAFITPRQFTLHHIEYIRRNNCRVVIFHVVLWDFTLVDLFLLGEEINRVLIYQILSYLGIDVDKMDNW